MYFSKMNLLLLASGKLALPAFYQFAQTGMIKVLCIPEKEFEGKSDFLEICSFAHIEVIQVNKQNVNERLQKVSNVDAAITLSFSFILNSTTLNTLHKKWFNIHFGQLPKYAGPQPVFWHLVNGEKQCVITAHQMTTKVDAGPVILETPIPLQSKDTFIMTENKLAEAAINVMNLLIQRIQSNKITGTIPAPQNKVLSIPTYQDVCIQWYSRNAKQILSLIRACNPWNKGAITYYGNTMVKITEAQVIPNQSATKPAGEITIGNDKLCVFTIDHKCIEVTVIYTDLGFMSGTRFLEVYGNQISKFSVNPY